MCKIEISETRFNAGSHNQAKTGLLGYVSFVINGMLRVDCVTLRKNCDGRLALSYPERTDRLGDRHPILRPINTSARLDIERQVFNQLAISMHEAAPR